MQWRIQLWAFVKGAKFFISPFPFPFYPRDAMRRAGLSDGDVSGWLAVCHSPAGIVSKRHASWFLHRLIAPWFHSLARYNASNNSQGVSPSEGDLWEWGGFERAIFAIFWPTRWAKKVNPKCSTHNFVKYWPIFIILSLLQSPENLQCSGH